MIAWLSLILAILPLALTIANLRWYHPPVPVRGAKVSVLFPARDEEANIALAVLNDDSRDKTLEILAGIEDMRLRVVHGHGLLPGWIGKQLACWRLAQYARHELMIFVDADVRMAPDAYAAIAGYMTAHPEMAMASGVPRQITVSWSEGLLLPLIHFLLLGYLPMAVMARSPSVGLGAGCGQLIVVRRSAYLAVGGHEAIRSSIMMASSCRSCLEPRAT